MVAHRFGGALPPSTQRREKEKMRLPAADLERLRELAQSVLTGVQLAETMSVHPSREGDAEGCVMDAKLALGRADDAIFGLLDLVDNEDGPSPT